MGRGQFTFYRSYYEAIKSLSKKEQTAVLLAICAYALDETEPKLDRAASSQAFESVRHTLDIERRQSAEGRRCSEYKLWRASVFKRDDYTCQTCGVRGVKLNAHHKKAYALFPELRYSLQNGVTLCETCHKALHRRNRYGD